MNFEAASAEDLADAPFAVVDLETTGLSPRLNDRIVEVAIVRVSPGGAIEEEFATLIDPGQDTGPAHLHGIASADVAGAPAFAEVIGDVAGLLRGAVLVAHSARFDADFLAAEFAWAGASFPHVPTMCTLHLSYLLYPGLGHHGLAPCCTAAGIPLDHHHSAIADARATATLLLAYLDEARGRGLSDLVALGCRPSSFARVRWPEVAPSGRFLRRGGGGARDRTFLGRLAASSRRDPAPSAAVADYLVLLDQALEDRVITEREARALAGTAEAWGLSRAQVEGAHRAYVAALIRTALEDGTVSPSEWRDLNAVCRELQVDKATLDLEVFGLMSGADTDAWLRQPVPPPSLAGLTVCFAGAMRSRLHGAPIDRARAEELARAAGLRAVDVVTTGLGLLVVADSGEAMEKAVEARGLGVKVMAEAAFWRAIGQQVE